MDSEIATASADDSGDGSVATLRRPSTAHSPQDGRAPADRRTRAREAVRFAAPIVLFVLGMKALIYTWGVVVRQVIEDKTYTTFADYFSFWNAWDAHPYLWIAQHGYQAAGERPEAIVFFPAYPYAVRFMDVVAPGGLLTSAFVVSGLASVAAALLLAVLVRHDSGDEARAGRAVWFLMIFPTAYFLHLPYTEGLFLSFVLGSFVAARTGHWGVAGVVGALAALTRINGAILIPALAVEAYMQYRRTGRLDRSWLWIAFIGTGTLVYLGINQKVFGDPFHFQDVQAEHWYKHLQDPFTSIADLSGQARTQPTSSVRVMLTQELVFLAIGLVAGLAALRWTRPAYGVWVLLNVLLFASTSWIQSTPRYALSLFPIFMLLAMIDRQVWLSRLVSAWSLLLLVCFSGLFALNRWAF